MELKMVTSEQLELVAAQVREILPDRSVATASNGKGFEMPGWLERQGLEVAFSEPWKDGATKYILAQCPLNPEHKGSAFVIQFPSGALSAGCHHDSCAELDWNKLRAMYDPKPESPFGSDDALALEYSAQHSDDRKYCASTGNWLGWTGERFATDECLQVHSEIRTLCRTAAKQASKAEQARRLASAATVSAVERLARSAPQHAVTIEEMDSNPWLLNTEAGTIELHSGKLRPHRREDLITQCTTVSAGGDCPQWLSFLARVTNGDAELQQYLARMIGYCLTGSTREHALFFLYGTGANGKSVFLNTVTGILGPYARTAPMELLIASRNAADRHPTDIAGLRGARLVTATEVEKGGRWDEPKIKQLTGGDRITARKMRQDFFEFTPQFKLLLAGNHKPALRGVDQAIRRRFNLVPFTVTIPAAERDPELGGKLRAEWSGILAWAIDGCLEWQRHGLNPPACVRAETNDYFSDEDSIGLWIAERCILSAQATATASALYLSWKLWADRAGEFIGSQKAFGQSLSARNGISRIRTAAAWKYSGIRLREVDDPVDPDDPAAATVTNVETVQ
ncbi:MAG: phage/plasmid primase, P4 family [Terriglobales bacterium]|jgi:putative DNA primase/helicase